MLNVTSMISTKKTATEYTRIIPTKKNTKKVNWTKKTVMKEMTDLKKAVKHIKTNEQSDRRPS